MQANYQPKIIIARKTRKSVECLQEERNMLLKEVKDLKEKNQFQKEAIEKYRVNNQTQYVELKFRWWFLYARAHPMQCWLRTLFGTKLDYLCVHLYGQFFQLGFKLNMILSNQ